MNIVLGVTGGIAAYKAVSLARLLVLAGHDVHVVPTADALRFVGLPTWEAISRNPVTVSVHEDVPEVRHVRLGQQADLVIVAPATANTLARMSAGIADDLLGTTLLATRAPVLVAPAMHTEMWQHAATEHNIAVLRERGVHFVGPDSGQLTGTDSGPGRMSEPEAIALEAERLLRDTADAPTDSTSKDFAGKRMLVSAGGTREPIDPVRYIGNRSSGRQGVALAAAAAHRGADVVLVAANIESAVLSDAAHPHIRVVQVGTAAEMQHAIEAELSRTSDTGTDADTDTDTDTDTVASNSGDALDAIIMAAAVSDYRVTEIAGGKIRKEDSRGQSQGQGLTIELAENPDILAGLVKNRREPGLVIVGFAAETVETEHELIERGKRKRARKGVDLLAVNAVGWTEGFESGDNSLTLIDASDTVTNTVQGSKREVADALLTEVLALLS